MHLCQSFIYINIYIKSKFNSLNVSICNVALNEKITTSRQTGALAGVAQWIECWPVNQKVSVSIPSQGTCLDCRPHPL